MAKISIEFDDGTHCLWVTTEAEADIISNDIIVRQGEPDSIGG